MANIAISALTTAWNAVGTAFTAIKMNVTDTASAAGSLLMDLQVGGVSRFNVSKSGILVVDQGVSFNAGNGAGVGQTPYAQLGSPTNLGIGLSSSSPINWYGAAPISGSADLVLRRDAANTLAQRNGVNAQTFRAYNTYTDASNYERGVFDWTTTANTLTIGAQNAGTGATRQVVIAGGANVALGSGATDSVSIRNHGYEIRNYYAGFAPFTAGNSHLKNTDANNGWGYLLVGHMTLTNTSGSTAMSEIRPTYNQVSGTASNTDLLITRTDTAVGSGLQRLIDAVVNGVSKFSVSNTGQLEASTLRTATPYTVATLPTGSAGMRAYVTDAMVPTFMGTLTGGGAVVTPVFHNGTAWIAG